MANDEIYIAQLGVWLARALSIASDFADGLDTDELGFEMPDAVAGDASVAAAGTVLADAAEELENAATGLETAVTSGNKGQLVTALVALVAALLQFIDALKSFVQQLQTLSGTLSGAERTAFDAFLQEMVRRTTDHVAVTTLSNESPRLAFLLRLLGLIEVKVVEHEGAQNVPRHVRRRLHFDRIKDLISDPGKHFATVYNWGAADFDPFDIMDAVLNFYAEDTVAEVGKVGDDAFLETGPFRWSRDSSVDPPGLQIEWRDDVSVREGFRAAINEAWDVGLSSDIALSAGTIGRIGPLATISVEPPTGELVGEFRLFIERNPAARPFVVVPGGGLFALSINNTYFGLGLNAKWNSVTGKADVSPLVFSDISGVTIRIGTSDSDSFVGNMLSNSDIEGQFDIGLEWQMDTGLRIKASGGIEIALPIHKGLGNVEVETIYLALRILQDGTLALEVSSDISGKLGPLSASIQRLGANLDLQFTEGTDADFGFFNLDLGFKWPMGVALAIDAQGVKGGGFLEIDRPNSRYAGILQLEFQDKISLTAIGLITTKLPDGSDGFSLLILISAEFQPIQLGMGFTLNGVGGLMGLNRTMVINVLREGVRDNSLDGILFPEDPVANAMQIISDLRAAFPPHEGQFVIGPMAKIGYGTPTLISLELGLVIEQPDPVRIAILGVLKAALPAEEGALIVIQVNFLGTIDFEKGQLTFDASLFDSRLLAFDLSGDMAVRVYWKGDPTFLLSVGGFHPSFQPPPLNLPALRRLTLQLLKGNNPRLRLETYLAVTSNTVQFGARLELYAGAGKFNVYGFLAFDVLFQFNPFYFIAAIGAMLALRVGSSSIASISLSLTLEGTTPWKAKGTAKLKLFWFLTIKVKFSKTWGETRNTLLGDIAVLPLVKKALEAKDNWQAQLPSQRNLLVSLKEIAPVGDKVVVHPFGGLTVSQKVVPLNIPIDKFGNQKPSDFNKFSISGYEAGGAPLAAGDIAPTKDHFAPAQFFKRSDTEKLSADSFIKYDAGFSLGTSEQLESSHYVKRDVEYELSYRDSQRDVAFPVFAGLFQPNAVAFNALARNGAVARSPLSFANTAKSALAPEAIQIDQEKYAVAQVSDLAPASADAVVASEAEAFTLRNRLVAEQPSLAGKLQVIPSYELNEAVPV